MKNKIILGSFISIFLIFNGCENTVEPNNSSKAITIIDEVKMKNENNIETKLLYKIPVSNGLNKEKTEIKVNFINENIFEITFKPQYGVNKKEAIKKEILKVRMGKIEEGKDSNDLNNVTWEELDIKGYLLEEAGSGTSYKIIRDNKVYNLNKDGRLKEIKAYRNVGENALKESGYYHNLYNDDANVLYSDRITKTSIIDLKSKKVMEDKDLEEMNGKYNIFKVEENLTYVWTLEKIEDSKYDEKLKIGYIKENKFQDIFEKDDLIIKNQKLTFNLYKYLGENKILLNEDKILFSGVINDINGIWHYDMKMKELSLQMKLEDFEVSYMYLSNNKEVINISTRKINEDETLKSSSYIGSLNKNFRITGLKNFIYEAHGMNNKHFLDFYEDSKKMYYKSDLGSKVENVEVYEVYEIIY